MNIFNTTCTSFANVELNLTRKIKAKMFDLSKNLPQFLEGQDFVATYY